MEKKKKKGKETNFKKPLTSEGTKTEEKKNQIIINNKHTKRGGKRIVQKRVKLEREQL